MRLVGLRWGLPNALHSCSYHPDEFFTIGAALFVYLNRSWDPKFYNYPSLYIYLCAMAIAITVGYGFASGADSVYLAARSVTVIMGVGAVAATYWAGREMFGKTVGLYAALILAIAPLHVQHSHFATVDVPSTLFIALCFGYSALIYKRGNWREYLFAGVMAGLAAGTKYNAVIIVFSLIAAHFLRNKIKWSSIISGRLWASLGCVIATFIISTPGSVFRTGEFLHGLTYEMKHASTGHGLVFAGTGNGFIYTLTSSLCSGLGPLLAFMFILAVIAAVYKRDKYTLIILAFAVPYYVLISISQVRFARYTLPLYPAICLMCGWLICYWWERLLSERKPLYVIGRWIWAGFCTLAIGFALFFSTVLNILLIEGPDIRDCAAQWIFKNVPKQSSLGMMDLPWFYSPPLSKDFGFGAVTQREQAVEKTPYRIIVFSKYGKPDQWYPKDAPDWIVISEYETRDALRLKNNKNLTKSQRIEVDFILDNLKIVKKHYTWRWSCPGMWDGDMDLYTENLPHDMRYVSPGLTIYERKK